MRARRRGASDGRPRARRGSSASTARAATSWCATAGCPADLAAGDLLAVAATGAYCRAMASNYNRVPRPAGGRGARRRGAGDLRRETDDDLLRAGRRLTGDVPHARRPSSGRAGWRPRQSTRQARRTGPDVGRRGRAERARGHSRVALLGCGTSAPQVVRLLHEQADDLAARVGAPLELVGIAVRDRPDRARPGSTRRCSPPTPRRWSPGDVDVVVEVIGGIEPARTLLLAALKRRSRVVTANKALLAEDGATLHAAAPTHGVDLYYEASVAGRDPAAAPAARVAGRRRHHAGCSGIVNGTTNFILVRMDDDRRRASPTRSTRPQALGYAEADPTADVDGFDAAAKAAILASLAFHTRVTAADVHREGITEVTAADIAAARELGCVVKLLAICERTDADGTDAGRRRPGAPGDDPAQRTRWPRCAGRSTRCSSRPRRPAS